MSDQTTDRPYDLPDPAEPLPPDRTAQPGPESAPDRPRRTQIWVDFPKPKKSRKRIWLTLGIIGVLLTAGVITAVMVLSPERRTTLITPPTVAGLTLDTDPENLAQLDQMKADLLRETAHANEVVAAYYNDPGDETKYALLLGLTGDIPDPVDELTSFLAFNPGIPTKIYDIDPGPLGGRAKCNEEIWEGLSGVGCAWADDQSSAVIVFYNRDAASSEVLFRQMRSEIQTRG